MSRSKAKGRVLALVLAAALAVSACSGDDDDNSASTTSETTESTTSTSESTTTADPKAEAEAEVEAAYEAQWDAYVKIFENPNPDNPLIMETYTGASLESILDGVSRYVLNGQALRLPADSSNWVVKVLTVEMTGSESARVRACLVNGLVAYDLESGDVVDDATVTRINDSELTLEDGRWKVAAVTTEKLEGNPGCDTY